MLAETPAIRPVGADPPPMPRRGAAAARRAPRHLLGVLLATLALGAGLARADCVLPEPPTPVGDNDVVQFINESDQTLLLGAHGPTAVLPREGTWEMPPCGVLTLDLPPSWFNLGLHAQGVRFWARTGCRYDVASGLAQCETGDCGQRYDCSAAGLAGVAPTTLAEFCLHCGQDRTFWDISAVDGVNLSADVTPLGNYPPDSPVAPGDKFWCVYPNSVPGADLRATCPDDFQWRRSQLGMYIVGSEDAVVACFSNCGLYEHPIAPSPNCLDSDPNCVPWRTYCCAAKDYGKKCTSDSQCTYGGACWEGVCSCRGFTIQPNCPPDVCTNQEPDAQPPFGLCDAPECIGDDTVHEVLPRAYSWPNDPQTYNCITRQLRVTFAPGGSSVPITPASGIPACSSLPAAYGYAAAEQLCSGVANRVYGGAHLSPASWDCVVSMSANTSGVLCKWGTSADAPDVDTPAGVHLGHPAVGASSTGSLRIGNTGNQPLSLSNLSLPGTEFTYANPPASVPAGGSVALALTFTPQAAGPRSDVLTIVSDDPDESPLSIDLTGQGSTAASAARQTLTGSGGLAERFLYSNLGQANGVITGFEPEEDVLDLNPLLNGLGYIGTDPFADGTVTLTERRGSVYVNVDPDGRKGPNRAVTLTRLDGVALAALVPGRDIVWKKTVATN